MIFVARLLSLVGVTVTMIGMGTIAIMTLLELNCLLPAEIQDYWLSILFVTSFGTALLMIGQSCGNDLFKVRGKDSIFGLKTGSDSRNNHYIGDGGSSFGGDGGSCD